MSDRRGLVGLAIGTAMAIGAVAWRGDQWIAKAVPGLGWSDFGLVALCAATGIAIFPLALSLERRRTHEPVGAAGTGLILLAIGIAAVSLLILLVAPSFLTFLLIEDGVAEIVSAVCLFASAILMLASAAARPMRWPTRLAFVAAGAVLGLIGLEEVSWFQRVIGLETPGWLAEINAQQELNFHNAATWQTEQLYYAGAFALCVLGRFSADLIRFPAVRLMPSLAIMAAGAIACGVNYDMWPTVPVQLAFFVALSAMIAVALASDGADRHRRRLLWGTVAALVLTQGGFLVLASLLDWPYMVSELRETLIALTLFAYAVQVAAPYWLGGMGRLSAGGPEAPGATGSAKPD